MSESDGQLSFFEDDEFGPPKTENWHLVHNEVWDLLTGEVFRMAAATPAQRQQVGRLQREIGAALWAEGFTVPREVAYELRRRVAAWHLHFPGATLTPNGLAKHIGQLGGRPLRLSRSEQEQMEDEFDRQSRKSRLAEMEKRKELGR